MPADPSTKEKSPAITDLMFRPFRGESDYPDILAVMKASEQADPRGRSATLEDIARNYSQLVNCDPYRDMIFAEAAGEVVGYSRGWWWEEPASGRLYGMVGFLVPAWRRKGIGRAMLRWVEARLRQVAAAHPAGVPGSFQVDVAQSQAGVGIMLEREGYRPVRYFYEMVRPTLEDIPDWPLPEGLEIRPAQADHYRAIWASVDESSQDEWGYKEGTEQAFHEWVAGPLGFRVVRRDSVYRKPL